MQQWPLYKSHLHVLRSSWKQAQSCPAKAHSSKPLSNVTIGPSKPLLVYILTKCYREKKPKLTIVLGQLEQIEFSNDKFCVKIQLESLQLTINSQSIIRSLKTHNINNYTVLRQQGVFQVIRSVQVPHLCNIHSCFDFNKYISNIKVFVLVTKT